MRFPIAAVTLLVLPAAFAGNPQPVSDAAFRPVQPELFAKTASLSNAWADFDGDGDADLVVTFYDGAVRLYRNDGGAFVSVGAALGLPEKGAIVRGAAWGDYDADGDPDLYLGTAVDPMPSRNFLYRNESGKRFVETAVALGVDRPGADSRQSSWVDYDGDGDLDLFVADRSGSNRLYRNEGSGAPFADVSDATGLDDPRRTVGACWFDSEQDGDLDLFLVNQQGDKDAFYRNDGGRFTDIAAQLGIEQPHRSLADGGVGCAIGDYDNDGDFDIFVAGYGLNHLYRNDGANRYVDVAVTLGITGNGHRVGASWGDYDNDGDLDLYVGAYIKEGYLVRAELYRNDGTRFVDVITPGHVLNKSEHGVQWADFDGDGDLDIALTDSNEEGGTGHQVLRNEASPALRARSLQVRVLDRHGRETRAGSEVRLYDRNENLLGTRLVATGDGYDSQSVLPVHFGLKDDGPVIVEVAFITAAGRKAQRVEVNPEKRGLEPLIVRQDP